jgi:uncharacterized heparinase superfamily protein
VWTFSARDCRVELEDSVYLAGSDGPRRTTQMVIHGNARAVPRVLWILQQANSASQTSAGNARRTREDAEPRLPL